MPLGRMYALASGRLEITYTTGATVTLEGPSMFIAEANNSGFLVVGKLSARLHGRRERGNGKGAEPPEAKSTAASDALFLIRTPTTLLRPKTPSSRCRSITQARASRAFPAARSGCNCRAGTHGKSCRWRQTMRPWWHSTARQSHGGLQRNRAAPSDLLAHTT